MAKKLKKNGFIDGTLITYASVVFTKVLGAFYIIPFTAVVGKSGMIIYNCVYLIYNLVLSASTSGIPTAMSILIAEQNSKGNHRTKMKYYRVGMLVTVITGFVLFLLLQIFAVQISEFYIGNSNEIAVSDLVGAVRITGICLLLVPFLSIFRGFLQGQNILAVSSYSQVIEQVGRVAVVLFGSYIAVKILNLNVSVGVDIAMLGAAIGALLAIIYLKLKTRNSDDVIAVNSEETDLPSTWFIIKRFIAYSIPVFIVAISSNLYENANNKIVVSLLTDFGFENGMYIGSIISTYGPKISMIVFSLSMGLTASIVPAMSAHVANKEYKEANQKLCTAINIILGISVPMSMGIFLLSDPIYSMFYGTDSASLGGFMMKFIILISVVTSIKMTLCMAMQGLKKTFTVCFATITGLLVDIALCYGFISRFYNVFNIGELCYTGAFLATVISQSICIAIILISLRKTLNFRYGSILKTGFKVLVPTVVMSLLVGLLQLLLPVPIERGLMQIVYLCGYALLGGLVYLVIAYKNGALYDIFGENQVDRIMIKLHLKK